MAMHPAPFPANINPTLDDCCLPESGGLPDIQVSAEIQGLENYISYIFRFALTPITGTCAQLVRSDVYWSPDPCGEEEHVAFLLGNILLRPNSDFLQDASVLDPELRHLADMFFNPVANASKIHNPKLLKLASEPGGFFSILKVEVKPSHRALDLGLQLLHQTLIFLRNKWIIAVIKPVPFPSQRCMWNIFVPFPDMNRDRSPEELKLRRHFSRLGFVQAGRDLNTSRAMYLTEDTFFPAPGKTITWIKKEEAERKQFCMVKEHKPRGIDSQLRDIMLYRGSHHYFHSHPYPLPAIDIAEIEVLLAAGASVRQSRVLHVAAQQGADFELLRRLLVHGGDINALDESGNRPLHEAAAHVSEAVPDLVKLGACKNAKNNNNDTAFELLLRTVILEQATFDFVEVKPVPSKRDLTKLRNAVLALLPSELSTQLIDRCMSPRMHKLLLLTAAKAAEVIMDNTLETSTDKALSQCRDFCTTSSFLEYVPLRVLLINGGKNNKSFMLGWACVFGAISECLEGKELPSVARVRQRLNEWMKGETNDGFLDKGGRIEFALDAVISITEKACKNKSEFWSYLISHGEIESLVETPLDNLFQIVTAMCFDRCDIIPRGPYESSIELLYKID